ncbi:TetR/AcrR family transcriptional regulator [Streptomyces spongiae]|uniref:TetR/AcrR family transcriptional regulator n=1 Tax=Streptomyces spongiae TaxID=565072 RepID=A0A5N8XA94_9ACTN|nr:TetR/AcrR family transcriptional regulator [Streptomyces spongiae]MPY56389.1 TetR/AcrR family transcriptional regulator [Streptomyces spongiae]
MKTTNAGRGQETRARLLSAAIECFATKGYHAASTRDIAKAAGISPTALYAHHESKEDLLYLIALDGHEEAVRIVRTARASSPNPVAQLRALMHDFVMHHATSHLRSRVVNYELNALNRKHLREIGALRRQIVVEFRAVIDLGADSGVLEVSNRRMATNALISMCVDICRWYRDDGISPHEIADSYAELAVRSLVPQAPATSTPRVVLGQ